MRRKKSESEISQVSARIAEMKGTYEKNTINYVGSLRFADSPSQKVRKYLVASTKVNDAEVRVQRNRSEFRSNKNPRVKQGKSGRQNILLPEIGTAGSSELNFIPATPQMQMKYGSLKWDPNRGKFD